MVTMNRIFEQNITLNIILFVLVGTLILFQIILGLFEAYFLTQYIDLQLDLSCQDIWIGHVVGSMFDLLVPFISALSVIIIMTMRTCHRKKIFLKNILMAMTFPQIIQFVYAFWSVGSFESTIRLCKENLKNETPELWAAVLIHFSASCVFITIGIGAVGYQCIKVIITHIKNCYRKKQTIDSVKMGSMERSIVL
jgi:hypothetical protein